MSLFVGIIIISLLVSWLIVFSIFYFNLPIENRIDVKVGLAAALVCFLSSTITGAIVIYGFDSGGQPIKDLPAIGIYQIVPFSQSDYLLTVPNANGSATSIQYFKLESTMIEFQDVLPTDPKANTFQIIKDPNLDLKQVFVFRPLPAK